MIDTQQELISRQHEEIQILRHQLMCAEQTRDHLRETVERMRRQLDESDRTLERAVKEAREQAAKEAVDLVCMYCRRKAPLKYNPSYGKSHYHGYADDPEEWVPCVALSVREHFGLEVNRAD